MNPYVIAVIVLLLGVAIFAVIHFHVLATMEAKSTALVSAAKATVEADFLKAEIALHLRKSAPPVKALTPAQVAAYAQLAAANALVVPTAPAGSPAAGTTAALAAEKTNAIAAANAAVAAANAAAG